MDRTPIVEVSATILDMNQIRLKYYGLPGDVGPDLIMDEGLARSTIEELKKCLPEYQTKETV